MDRRSDVHAAIVAGTFANIHRAANTQPYPISDFIPVWEIKKPVIQTAEEQLAIFMAIRDAQNQRIKDSN